MKGMLFKKGIFCIVMKDGHDETLTEKKLWPSEHLTEQAIEDMMLEMPDLTQESKHEQDIRVSQEPRKDQKILSSQTHANGFKVI